MQNSTPTYPQSYHKILLALPEDGTPLSVPFGSAAAAQAERLRYYNFLKWCRRPKNASAVVHLNGRYNQVTLRVVEDTIQFALNTFQRFTETNDAIDKALAAAGLDIPPPPRTSNPHNFAQVPKGETTPLSPAWAMPADLQRQAMELAERSEQIAQQGVATEVKRSNWIRKGQAQ